MKNRALVAVEPTVDDRPGISVGRCNISRMESRTVLYLPFGMTKRALANWKKRNQDVLTAVHNIGK